MLTGYEARFGYVHVDVTLDDTGFVTANVRRKPRKTIMEEFAVNAKGLIAQIINFSIILLVLAKFAYRPVVEMLENRSNAIAEGLKNSEEAKAKLANTETEVKKIRDEAFAEAKTILAEAKSTAQASAKEIVENANRQADRIISQAKSEADAAKDQAMLEAKGQLSSLVMLSLEKVIGNQIDKSQREALTASAIKEL